MPRLVIKPVSSAIGQSFKPVTIPCVNSVNRPGIKVSSCTMVVICLRYPIWYIGSRIKWACQIYQICLNWTYYINRQAHVLLPKSAYQCIFYKSHNSGGWRNLDSTIVLIFTSILWEIWVHFNIDYLKILWYQHYDISSRCVHFTYDNAHENLCSC